MVSAIETFAGPLLVLIAFAFILYGVFFAQTYYYWTTYEADPIHVKVFVTLLWLFETCHTGFCIHIIYFYFIVEYGNLLGGLERIVWSAGISIYLEVAIVGLTQSFYLYRIWHLSKKNKLVTSVMVTILTMRMAFGFYSTTAMFKYHTWSELRTTREVLIPTNCTWALGVFVDLMITSVLVYYLYRNRSVGLRRTTHIIRKLMHYSISTGALTVIFSLIILVAFNTLTSSLLFGGMLEVLSKLYANSMLAMLNARRKVAATSWDNKGTTIELSTMHWNGDSPQSSRPAVVNIYKETSQITEVTGADREKTRFAGYAIA